jgi:hypothetical protein
MRKSTGKRLRFEVFKRDYFTCQYCGAQPPAVVLVVDHVTPVAAGGGTTLDNLVTACEPCNQGKADRSLGMVTPRQDADLLYLSTQQEVAEMRRYHGAVAAREAAIDDLVPVMQALWVRHSGLKWHPTDLMIRHMLNSYPVDVVGETICDVAHKAGTGYLNTDGRKWIGYMHKVAQNLTEAQGEDED